MCLPQSGRRRPPIVANKVLWSNTMELYDYFENTKGTGVLATADAEGHVDAALYASPHVLKDGTVAFIMRQRLSYHNVTANPKAAYLFLEEGSDRKGIRLYMTKLLEETDPDLIAQLRRKLHDASAEPPGADARMVVFQVDLTRPLTGDA
jgi:hypothetical protein